ncbi:P-loop containing nucleoside triphosphate hydrolase protein, partial [Limtongia smithiae]|uniref:P-loop containing nucleoside triphosphate hydrolase protein n=1 Tax=Limtongia smithiae TaxID=1125753 RepID=UPI0034D013F7
MAYRTPRRSALLSPNSSISSPHLHHARRVSTSSAPTDRPPSPPSQATITVSVRLKPAPSIPTNSSAQQQQQPQWTFTPTSLSSPDVGAFTFDHVFDGSATSRAVYDATARSLVHAAVDGYHATVFAYGMTGTGKTYSMRGIPSSPGIIPLAISDIFAQTSFATTTISVSYLEIYNERVRDLLNPATPHETLKLQDTQSGIVRVSNLRCVRVTTVQELRDYISQGDAARRTEGTEYNAVSSRSHAVVQIFLEKLDSTTALTSTSVLSLCDLAGSERAAADAERRKEGAYINRSLLALGTIISRLSSPQTPASEQHIPYRDSKLTRLLQHSLSGNALVAMLCTVDTAATTRHAGAETANTLRFAARAKNI